MEGMNLAKLEAMVEKMLNNLNELRRENATLQARVEARDAKIADLEAKIDTATATQEEVGSRVANLLNSIEEWERSIDSDEQEEEVVTDEESAEEEEVEKPKASGRGTNLFSMG